MKHIPDWLRVRLHAALDQALNDCPAPAHAVEVGFEGEDPHTFYIRIPTLMTDDGLDGAMDMACEAPLGH